MTGSMIRETGDMEEFADIRQAFDVWTNRYPHTARLEWQIKDVQDALDRLSNGHHEIES